MKMSVAVEIMSPKNKVWTAITDIEHSKNMLSSIIDLTVLSKPEEGLVGFRWTETRKIFGKESSETMWIIEAKEQEYYIAHAQNKGALYATKIAVTQIANKTLLTMSFSATSHSKITKFVSAVMGIFIKKSMVKMMHKDLHDIKIYLENNQNT